MEKEIALKVENISKKFKIPNDKISTLRGHFINIFKAKEYETFNALEDVSFDVKKGEFFGIIGRNGSGKSTLLKILAKIYQPDKGKIKINGMISPFLELGIGFNPELSGRDNIYLNATVLGLTKKQIDEKFDEIVAFSELERFIDQKIRNYSSGMQVRLAFSVSIHARRDILLMDEVLAVGDMNFQQKCLDEFKKYKQLGKTVILVTHSMGTVKKYCDRALLLDHGKILKLGDVVEVCDEYVSKNLLENEENIETEEGYPEEKNEIKNNIIIKKIKEEIKEEIKKEIKEEIKKEKKNIEEKKEPLEKDKIAEKPEEQLKIIEIKKNKICGVSFLNDDKSTNIFTREDDIKIIIEILLQDFGPDVFVGIEILDVTKNASVCVVNTLYDDFKHKWNRGNNLLEVVFKKGCFNKGRFFMKIVLFKENAEYKKILDIYNSQDDEIELEVISLDRRSGLIFSEHSWKQKENKREINFKNITRLNATK